MEKGTVTDQHKSLNYSGGDVSQQRLARFSGCVGHCRAAATPALRRPGSGETRGSPLRAYGLPGWWKGGGHSCHFALDL